MSGEFINGWTFNRGQGDGPPETFGHIPKVEGLGGLGQTNPLVRVTNFDSDAEEYIAGLADGSEFSLDCIRLLGNAQQEAMIQDVRDKANRNLKFENTDGTTVQTYSFNVVCTGFELQPSYDDKNGISFKYKISGDIVITND